MTDFKVGDRVRVLEDNANHAEVQKGETGVIDTVEESDYTVRMDRDGVTWFFEDQHIERIDEPTVLEAEFSGLLESLAEAASQHNVAVSLHFTPLGDDA